MFYTSLRVLWRTCFSMLTIYFLHTKSCKLPTFSDCEVLETYKLDANSTSRPALLKCKFSLCVRRQTNERVSGWVRAIKPVMLTEWIFMITYNFVSCFNVFFFLFCESNFGVLFSKCLCLKLRMPRGKRTSEFGNMRAKKANERS